MLRATIYARQSLDRYGDSLAVTRQLELCRAFCEQKGWEVAEEFVDNDRSATSGAERPAFERLLASSPERIVVWHVDRLVRLTKDLERVIQLGVNVHAVEAGHLDLSNPAGRAVARTVTAWATYEGEQKALRQRASNDQRAAAGRPSAGRRCFGFTADGLELVEEEAEVTRRAVAELLSGVPLRTVMRQLNEEGVVTTAGKPWTATSFRRYLQLPRLAAHRVHRGEVVGKGGWSPIISEDQHEAVVALLQDPARKPRGRPRIYLLSGVSTCGVCGAKLYGRQERRGPLYACMGASHVARRAEPLDQYVEAVMVARLSRPDIAELLAADDDSAARGAALREERLVLTGRLDELAEAFAAGLVTVSQLTAGSKALRERLASLEEELAGLVVTGQEVGRLATSDDVQAAWDALETAVKREVIGRLAEVVVSPAGRGARRFDPSTVAVRWR